MQTPQYVLIIQFIVWSVIVVGNILVFIRFIADASQPGPLQNTLKKSLKAFALLNSPFLGASLPIGIFYLISAPSPNHTLQCLVHLVSCPATLNSWWNIVLPLIIMATASAIGTTWGVCSLIKKYFP